MDSARCLSMSLKSHSSIENLDISHCDLGSNPEILLVILQSDIKWITLDNNNIDSLGAVKIAEYLEGNPPIHQIDLDHNRLNDDDVILISQALKRNTNLETLRMHSNNITSIGVKTLLMCFFDSSSLNAISGSNHTLNQLIMMCWTSNIVSQKLNGYVRKLLELGKIDKIFLAMQDKDFLLKCLANVPVELIPEVLEFTRWVDDQPLNKHLNIFYSIMRWWNMPLLYSHH
jgi:Ran GTPase-activating protein (RanGAP) involved in mRNA processing and transport